MSRPLWPVLALLCHVPAAASAQAPTHRIEAADHQTVTAAIGYEVHTTSFAITRWSVFLPEPPELPSQTRVKVASTPDGKVIAEKGPLARKLRLIDVPVANPVVGSSLTVRLDVQATLRTRKLVPLAAGEKPPAVAALTAAERKAYLAPTPRIDFNRPAFKDWLLTKKLRRGKGESPLDFAARVLEVIRSDYAYRYHPAEDRRSSVTCGRPATDCGGMALVFVGAMRASDIPARVLIGRLARPRKPGTASTDEEYDQPHARVELYVGGVGWVPVDPARANGMKDRPVAAFVGEDPGDMLVLHADLGLRLPLPDGEKVIDLLQIEPYVWVAGRGRLDLTRGPTAWAVTTTPAGGK